jgi:hypothetical protein
VKRFFSKVMAVALAWALVAPAHAGVCAGDVNNDNSVNADDVTLVILTWGCTNPPGPCPGDANNSGAVDADDLVMVILNWGPCAPVNGACCVAGACSMQTQTACVAGGGTFLGNPTCSGVTCPLANDNCAGAIPLQTATFPAAPATNNGSNAGATNGTVPTPACITFNGVMTRDVWYRYTVPTTPPSLAGHILRLQLCDTPNPFTDTVLAVYSGTCAGLTLFACNDSACGINGLRSSVETPMVPAGSTVYIRVGSWGNGAANQGPFILTAQVVELTDDTCMGAHALTVPGSATGVLNGATADIGPTCQGVDSGVMRWYRVVGNGTTYTASTCNSMPDIYNGIIMVYCGGSFGCAALNCVAGTNADLGQNNPAQCAAFQGERVSWCAVNNQTYYVGVGVVATGLPDPKIQGHYTLEITPALPCAPSPPVDCAAGSPPPNDDCSLAPLITTGNTAFNNAIATPQEAGAGTVCGQPWSKDLWFRYTSANGGLVTLTITSNPVFDSMCEVYSGTCTNLGTPVACEDDDASCVGCHPILEFNATAGTTYLIRITTWSNSGGGPGTLNILDP